MRTSDIIPLALLGATLAVASAYAFDGTRSPSDIAPAVKVDVVPRAGAAVSGLRSSEGQRRVTPGEAFRSGAQSLREGDTKAGLTSLEYAAAGGHPIAQWKLGRMYADGDGVKQNDLRAFEYFRGVADAYAEEIPGTTRARFAANAFVALGTYYLEGIPNTAVKADPDRAREMFAYAATYFGDADAQYNLGRIYLEGTGGQKDAKQAARWLQLASNKGHYQAQAVLGALMFKGEALPRQAARGLMWLTLARDAAGPRDGWITELHAAASARATDEERTLALTFLERWLKGRRD